MNIIPISSAMNQLTPSVLSTATQSELPFKNMFEQALADVEQTDAVKRQDSKNLAVGEVDDIAAIMINSEKADLAVQMLVQMRNKILDAYSEVMRMNI